MAFRDEEKTLPQSLPPLVDYTCSSQNARLILVDSASSDASLSVANKILQVRSELNSKFSIKQAKQPGKCLALNLAMKSREEGELVLIVDADVIISAEGIDELRAVLSDKSIGSASGIELIDSDSSKFSKAYKNRANETREITSINGSAIVLEGSMLMFDPDRIGWSKFDEGINADDAQISVSSITSGHRSIVCKASSFIQMSGSPTFSLNQSVRRGQGLVTVLIQNPHLFRMKGMFLETLRNWLLYLVVPWAVVLILSISAYIVSINISSGGWKGLTEYYNAALICMFLITTTGRSLGLGSVSMIIAHFRIFLGKTYNSWRPIR